VPPVENAQLYKNREGGGVGYMGIKREEGGRVGRAGEQVAESGPEPV
jgi:hypothetical protein